MTKQQNRLTALPNIGPALAKLMEEAGISNENELRKLGAENAFLRVVAVDKDACYCKLCALEGAIQGVRWHDLNAGKRAELKEFFEMAKK